MISGADVYRVFEAIVPLYVAMISAYISIKWWKLFTPDQCSGINKFVAKFSIPLLSFQVISSNNPYKMNLKLILSDTTQKLLAVFIFIIFVKLRYKCSLDWLITGFSLSTLPNTLIIGLPLLKAMYGDEASKLLSQIVVLQSLVWYTLLLFLFEVRAADEIIPDPTESSKALLLIFFLKILKLNFLLQTARVLWPIQLTCCSHSLSVTDLKPITYYFLK